MRFRFEHPTHGHVHADYGHDPHLGFFVEVHGRHGRRLDYDTTYADYSGLEGALAFLAKGGFFTLDDLYASLIASEHEADSKLTVNQRAVLDVIWNFKRAADPDPVAT